LKDERYINTEAPRGNKVRLARTRVQPCGQAAAPLGNQSCGGVSRTTAQLAASAASTGVVGRAGGTSRTLRGSLLQGDAGLSPADADPKPRSKGAVGRSRTIDLDVHGSPPSACQSFPKMPWQLYRWPRPGSLA